MVLYHNNVAHLPPHFGILLSLVHRRHISVYLDFALHFGAAQDTLV